MDLKDRFGACVVVRGKEILFTSSLRIVCATLSAMHCPVRYLCPILTLVPCGFRFHSDFFPLRFFFFFLLTTELPVNQMMDGCMPRNILCLFWEEKEIKTRQISMDLSAWKKTDSQLVSTMDITFYRGLFQQVDFSVPSKQFYKDSSLYLCLCHFMKKVWNKI